MDKNIINHKQLYKKDLLTRRNFLKSSGISLISLSLSPYLVGCGSTPKEKKISNSIKINAKSLFKAPKSGSFIIDKKGDIPLDLQGTLYRNGPSIFERGGFKKNNLLDGDGYITKLSINNANATLSGEYVKTDKFIKEDKANEFTEDTFTTIKSDNDNKSALTQDNDSNKSSVSIRNIDGELYAFEESFPPYKIDKETLSTTKSQGFFQEMPFHSAHGKKDVKNGDFINFGIQMGDPTQNAGDIKGLYSYLHVYVLNNGNSKMYRKIKLTGIHDDISGSYMHDFFVTDNYIIFNVQPLLIDLRNMYPANKSFGLKELSLAHSFTWKPNLKNKLLIISRKNPNAKPLIIETHSAKFSWHTINAYENNQAKITLDFIAYDDFNFFTHNDPLTKIIKEGELDIGNNDNKGFAGYSMRYEVSLEDFSSENQFFSKGNIKEEILSNSYRGDFPMINPKFLSKSYKFFYQGLSEKEEYFINGIGKFNTKNTQFEQVFFFPKEYTCGEPIFAPKSNPIDEDDGYLIATCHNLAKQQTFIAIFDAKNIKQGPVSKLILDETLPYRLHGEWV